ncbi:hypothetical protein KEM55_005842 [Ascosphaera atra]|nr:hypothetical protein KEM55_005842 [Ascosphaera atra]
MGFVAYHTGSWQWIYWILAITNAVQFILYLFFSPETLYNRDIIYNPALDDSEKKGSTFVRQYFKFGRIDPTPMTFRELFAPVKLFLYPSVLLPAIAYAIVFQFCSVMGTVEIPQIFQPKFHFNSQQIGLNFLALIIGSVLGEQLGGWGSDKWMAYGLKRNGGVQRPEPEFRLWLSYFAYGCIICGLVVFTVQTDKLEHYNVSPIVGLAIASFGNQVITTVCTTYAVDSHQNHSGSVGVSINFIRSTWGFIGPLYFPDMFANLGLRGSGGLMVGIVVAAALIPTMFIQWKGKSLRQRKYNKEMEDASEH